MWPDIASSFIAVSCTMRLRRSVWRIDANGTPNPPAGCTTDSTSKTAHIGPGLENFSADRHKGSGCWVYAQSLMRKLVSRPCSPDGDVVPLRVKRGPAPAYQSVRYTVGVF